MTGLLFILGGFLLFVVIATIPDTLRILRLRRERREKGVTREQFLSAFRQGEISDKISSAVYDYYSSRGVWKGFGFLPDDKYSKVLSDDPEDIEQDARTLVARLGLCMPPGYILAKWEKPIETLRDMVLWLDWVRQHQPAGCPR
jgi:hypothetical protein